MTGAELLVIWKRKTNSIYSQAYSTTQQSDILTESLQKECERIFKNSARDATTDYINNLVAVGVTAVVVNNTIDMTTEFADYSHFRDLQFTILDVEFKPVLTNLILTATTTTVVFDKASRLRTGELVKNTGTVIDGTYWVKQVNHTNYILYNDEALTIPAFNGIPYNNLGTSVRVVKRYAREYISGTKIASLADSTLEYPKYLQYTDTVVCYAGKNIVLESTADYLMNLTVLIDVTNTTTDLSLTYPVNLLYLALDRAAELFGSETMNQNLVQSELAELAKTQQ